MVPSPHSELEPQRVASDTREKTHAYRHEKSEAAQYACFLKAADVSGVNRRWRLALPSSMNDVVWMYQQTGFPQAVLFWGSVK